MKLIDAKPLRYFYNVITQENRQTIDWEATVYLETSIIQTYEPGIDMKIPFSGTKCYSIKGLTKAENTVLKQRDESLEVISILCCIHLNYLI